MLAMVIDLKGLHTVPCNSIAASAVGLGMKGIVRNLHNGKTANCTSIWDLLLLDASYRDLLEFDFGPEIPAKLDQFRKLTKEVLSY